MNKAISMVIATALSCAAFAVSINAEDKKNASISNKDKVVAVLNSIETGDQGAVAYINAGSYIQHNLAVGDGLAGFGEVLQALPKGSAKVSVKRVFADGDFVFIHTDYNFFGSKVDFDVFKFEDGKIIEHWDNLAEKAKKTNSSGRSQLDGPTDASDLDKTLENKKLVENFVDSILVKGEFDKLTFFINDKEYLQHNTDIADGLGKAIEALAKQGIKMEYKKVHKVLGEGNFVLAISEGLFGGKPISYYDLFRISEGKIIEHWDVIESISAKEEWKNDNGKFGGL